MDYGFLPRTLIIKETLENCFRGFGTLLEVFISKEKTALDQKVAEEFQGHVLEDLVKFS